MLTLDPAVIRWVLHSHMYGKNACEECHQRATREHCRSLRVVAVVASGKHDDEAAEAHDESGDEILRVRAISRPKVNPDQQQAAYGSHDARNAGLRHVALQLAVQGKAERHEEEEAHAHDQPATLGLKLRVVLESGAQCAVNALAHVH